MQHGSLKGLHPASQPEDRRSEALLGVPCQNLGIRRTSWVGEALEKQGPLGPVPAQSELLGL